MLVKHGNRYVVKSEKSGRNLSKPTTKAKAEKRIAQVEWFKNHGNTGKRK